MGPHQTKSIKGFINNNNRKCSGKEAWSSVAIATLSGMLGSVGSGRV